MVRLDRVTVQSGGLEPGVASTARVHFTSGPFSAEGPVEIVIGNNNVTDVFGDRTSSDVFGSKSIQIDISSGVSVDMVVLVPEGYRGPLVVAYRGSGTAPSPGEVYYTESSTFANIQEPGEQTGVNPNILAVGGVLGIGAVYLATRDRG